MEKISELLCFPLNPFQPLVHRGTDFGELGTRVSKRPQGVDAVGDVGVARVGVAGKDEPSEERAVGEGGRGEREGGPEEESGS